MANQLKFVINRGASATSSNEAPIFTASHKKKPKLAVAAFREENLLMIPRANNAAGIITAIAP